jgi:thiosulfate reductase/polysulfide reductase chain A
MMEEILSFCPICGSHCALDVTVKDGKAVDVKGAGESGFQVTTCSIRKGEGHILGILNAPDRLKYPLKRKGARGEGKWERITWDEALETMARTIMDIREKYGPEYFSILLGEPKGMEFHFAQRFGTAYGTPNVFTPGCYCGWQTGMATAMTFGPVFLWARPESKPKIIILWGSNSAHVGGTMIGLTRNDIIRSVAEGCKLVIVDPRNIEIWPEKGMRASDADHWLKVRPNSDGILAMGMIKVIIEEELYHKEFVKDWCIGFDELREEIKNFTLDDVEKYSWIPKEQVIEVARLYATNVPGVIGWGNALENHGRSLQQCRAIAILRALTANVKTPWGGYAELIPANYGPPGKFIFGGAVKERAREYPRSPERAISDFKLGLKSAFIPTQMLIKTLIEGKPYVPKAAWVILNNPLLTFPDSKATKRALLKLEHIFVNEVFHTPLTEIADLVLPAAWMMEHDTCSFWPGWLGKIKSSPKIVEPPGEAWSDMKIVNELAKKCGYEKYFWETEEGGLDEFLKPSGYTWREFRDNVKCIESEFNYSPDTIVPFPTPSGKVELFSPMAVEMGYTGVPTFKDLLDVFTDRFELSPEYPFVMTNYKSEVFFLSGYRNVKELLEKSPPPMAFMNTEAAKDLGLEDGDWIWIESPRGRIKHMLMTEPSLDPRVVNTEFGWGGTEEYKDCNVNVLTDYRPPYDPGMGTATLRGYPCKVYKARRKK